MISVTDVAPDPAATPPHTAKLVNVPNALTVLRLAVVPVFAVLLLQDPARRTTAKRPWAARLWYAYADALLDAGRTEAAHGWFARVAEVDEAGETDAVDRLLELDGVVLDGFDDEDEPDA